MSLRVCVSFCFPDAYVVTLGNCNEYPTDPAAAQGLDIQKDQPLRIINPRSHTPYILVPEMDYEAVRELLEDEHRQQTLHEVALRNAAGRMEETP